MFVLRVDRVGAVGSLEVGLEERGSVSQIGHAVDERKEVIDRVVAEFLQHAGGGVDPRGAEVVDVADLEFALGSDLEAPESSCEKSLGQQVVRLQLHQRANAAE